jgi:hypothetical protein
MEQTALTVSMQQHHAHFWSDGDRRRGTVCGRGVPVEDGLAARAGSEVDEEGPGRAGWYGGLLVGGLEVEGVGVVV